MLLCIGVKVQTMAAGLRHRGDDIEVLGDRLRVLGKLLFEANQESLEPEDVLVWVVMAMKNPLCQLRFLNCKRERKIIGPRICNQVSAFLSFWEREREKCREENEIGRVREKGDRGICVVKSLFLDFVGDKPTVPKSPRRREPDRTPNHTQNNWFPANWLNNLLPKQHERYISTFCENLCRIQVIAKPIGPCVCGFKDPNHL